MNFIAYSPVLRPAGRLEQQIDMHRVIANTLSKLRSEWASWISFWSFLVHLNDLDFYKELDEELEIRIAPSARAATVCMGSDHGRLKASARDL